MASETTTLEYISLEGYKSFRKLERFPLRPGLNVLIGANGSGKTNFIRFFELLENMLDQNKGLQNYVAKNGRADAFLFRGAKVTDEMRAQLWFSGSLDAKYEYSFTLRAAADRSLFFAREAPSFEPGSEPSAPPSNLAGYSESRITRTARPGQAVVDRIRNWRVYHFQDTSSQARVMGLCNFADSDRLLGDAGNIAAFLAKLRLSSAPYYERIIKTIRLVAPFFGDFELGEVSPGQTQLLWKERYSDLVFYPHQLSDGSIRFICLAVLLLQPNLPGTIIIDEPELGLHPYALEVLAGLFREAASRCQLIVSTQSRPLVDEFEPEDLIVVDRVDGETMLSRPELAALEKWLDDYSLGELWGKNVLGGRPHS